VRGRDQSEDCGDREEDPGHGHWSLVVIEPEGLTCMQPLLPRPFKSNYVGRIHVGRYSLQNGETKVSRIALPKKCIPPMPRTTVVDPPAEQVGIAVCRSDVSLSSGLVEDVVDAAPLRESRPPSARQHAQFIPGEVDLIPRRHSGSESSGHFGASLGIAGFVWARSLTTVVGEYAECSSGCAIVWFAGRERRILQGGRIGLHAARMPKDQRRSEAGTAAMIQFLRILGSVPEAVLTLIEQTEPGDIRWITRVEATEMGLVALESSPPPTERKSPAWLWDAQRGYSRGQF
jgi:hypothetical protein